MSKSKVIELKPKPQSKKIVRVAVYCRVSTEKSEQKNSIETQKKYFKNKFINSPTEELVEVYADTASGTSAIVRPGFQKLIED